MAPASNSARSLQQNQRRPTVTKSIIPAIPLPYIQKRKQQRPAREQVVEEVIPTPETPAVEALSPTPPATESAPSVVNGSFDSPVTEKTEDADQSAEVEAVTAPTLVDEAVAGPANRQSESPSPDEATAMTERPDSPEPPPSAPSEEPPSASRSDFHMPPPFVPQSQVQNNNNIESVRFLPQQMFNGNHPMHHPHPSAGSVMFGAYEESNHSSPAPPPSAGNLPPYPFQQPVNGGRHFPHHSNGGHSQHMSNGYSPMGPPPGYYPRHDSFQTPGANGDNYARRQMISFAPADGNPPSATPAGFEHQRAGPYDPLTPRSLHGSQSSALNEQDPAFYSQYPAVMPNGSNGHLEDVRAFQQPRGKPRNGSQVPSVTANPNFSGQMMAPPPVMDYFDGLIHYLQAQFADSELADYTLELRYSDDRAEPVRIPGHGLILGRSPHLKALMKAQSPISNGDGLTGKSLLIESDDRFLRSDAFWMAMHRLYGGPLLDAGAAAMQHLPQTSQQLHTMPGTAASRCELGLGYAAAGHLLQIPPVINRGAEIVSHFVSWDTIGKALDFALDGGLDAQWTYGSQQSSSNSSTYGPATNIIIYSVVSYIITAFPPNFELDTSVGEPLTNRRLPTVPEERPSNSRLSFIKFGDHQSEQIIKSESPSITATLSEVLINLPFHLLKYVLESPRLGNVEGWASTNLRLKVMHSVIGEREKRRMKVLSSAHVPRAEREFDDNVHWAEAVSPQEGVPTLTRRRVE